MHAGKINIYEPPTTSEPYLSLELDTIPFHSMTSNVSTSDACSSKTSDIYVETELLSSCDDDELFIELCISYFT